MKKQLLTFVFVLTHQIILLAQANTFEFHQLDSLQKLEERKTIVFIHTDWCKYCLKMKNTTLKNDSVINALNNNFYYVAFNAENKNDVTFNKHTFKYKPTGNNTGTNELAELLGKVNGKLNYPTICILNNKNEIIFQHSGYITSNEFIEVLKAAK